MRRCTSRRRSSRLQRVLRSPTLSRLALGMTVAQRTVVGQVADVQRVESLAFGQQRRVPQSLRFSSATEGRVTPPREID